MNKNDIVQNILRNSSYLKNDSREAMYNEYFPSKKVSYVFAPINIALCKYWGKRDEKLNLPKTSSLSITLPEKGAFTRIELSENKSHTISINGKVMEDTSNVYIQLSSYLNLLKSEMIGMTNFYKVDIDLNIPFAAGFASSASIYASLVKGINDLYSLCLSKREMSILARLGSGSACRSFWNGFVQWEAGKDKNGLDSFAYPLKYTWDNLQVGVNIINPKIKRISSRDAMKRTVLYSSLYSFWSQKVKKDIRNIKKAILKHDFELFGKTLETNSIMMHASMMDASPSIIYSEKETLKSMEKVWHMREKGIQIYFTQDAGPNLKLVFLRSQIATVKSYFPDLEILTPFPIQDSVILVDENDKILGFDEKILVHKKGLLHRAFSIFIVRKKTDNTEVLLQKRRKNKYHCGGLWSNTCCSHPKPGENVLEAAKRRLKEEMGFTTDLYYLDKFLYEAKLSNNLTEKELDYVFVGFFSQEKFNVNQDEVEDYKWISSDELEKDIGKNQKNYTPWFKSVLTIFKNNNFF